MSRNDLKELGESLDEGQAGLIVVGVTDMEARIEAAMHRSEKMQKPLTGDVIWSVPTLLTLNPIGSPIAHAGLHTSAVLHSYETDTFLPPHR